jgi:Na+/proline symporter
MAHFTWFDYTIFVAYLATLVIVGVAFTKGQHTIKDYFLAGRSMGAIIGWVAGIVTLVPVCFATEIGDYCFGVELTKPISFLWHGAIGCVTTFGVGWLASALLTPARPKSLEGLVFSSRHVTGEKA